MRYRKGDIMFDLKNVDRKVLDYETGLGRFMGKETLFVKFLMKFVDDKSFQSLKEQIENGECEEAFKAAHTLKGVADNLAFDELAMVAGDITEALRAQKLEEAIKQLPVLEEAYKKVQELLVKIKGEE